MTRLGVPRRRRASCLAPGTGTLKASSRASWAWGEKRRARPPIMYSHYSLLATEAIFNLGTLGRNDTSAAPMSDMFRGGIPQNAHLRFVDFFPPEVLRATAARMSALNVFASISSPS